MAKKKVVNKYLGTLQYRPMGELYCGWRYQVTEYDDGSVENGCWVMDGIFRPKLPWETEEVTLIDSGLKKLVRVRE